MNGFKGLLTAAAAAVFAFSTPVNASSLTATEIESWRDGLNHSNADLVQAHKDRLNRVLVAMDEYTPRILKVQEKKIFSRVNYVDGQRIETNQTVVWEDSNLANCDGQSRGWCREIKEDTPDAMTAAEARTYFDRFKNDRWQRIVDLLATKEGLSPVSWGSWATMPESHQEQVFAWRQNDVQDFKAPSAYLSGSAAYFGKIEGEVSSRFTHEHGQTTQDGQPLEFRPVRQIIILRADLTDNTMDGFVEIGYDYYVDAEKVGSGGNDFAGVFRDIDISNPTFDHIEGNDRISGGFYNKANEVIGAVQTQAIDGIFRATKQY